MIAIGRIWLLTVRRLPAVVVVRRRRLLSRVLLIGILLIRLSLIGLLSGIRLLRLTGRTLELSVVLLRTILLLRAYVVRLSVFNGLRSSGLNVSDIVPAVVSGRLVRCAVKISAAVAAAFFLV